MKEEIENLLKSEAEEVRNLLNSILAKETQLTNPLILGDAAEQLYGHAKTIAALKYELENRNERKTKMTKKEMLENCRRAYTERGAKLIEITHNDGTKSGIGNLKAIEVVMSALTNELDRQIAECK